IKKTFDKANSKVNDVKFKISYNAQLRDDDSTSKIENSKSCKPHCSDYISTLSKLVNHIKTQSVARVKGNNK
ncbi:MAG: hypothetical protein M1813_009710, partial [Trichoglossum hirsutum]